MLRDPVIQTTRLMPADSENVEGQGEESENPLVGITVTTADKLQPIKVSQLTMLTVIYSGDAIVFVFVSLAARKKVTVKMDKMQRFVST